MVDIRTHKAGYSLVRQLQTVQAEVPEQNLLGRFFGLTPLTSETRPWYVGLQGEIIVGAILDSLKKDGYTVLHSVPIGEKSSDIDHIVITPSGLIFAINTKHHRGQKVWGAKKIILLNGQKNLSGVYIRNSLYESDRVAKKFLPETKKVLPVLVFVNPESITVKEETELPLLNATKLLSYLVEAEALRKKQGISQNVDVDMLSDSGFWVKNYVDELDRQDAQFAWFAKFQKTVDGRYARKMLLQLVSLVLGIGAAISVLFYMVGR